TDTAVFAGRWQDYTISSANGVVTVTGIGARAGDGSDTVETVENFQFSNGTGTLAALTEAAPTNILLSAKTVAETAPRGAAIGILSDVDANRALGDTGSYTLINSAGGRFAISGNNLTVANPALLNREAAGDAASYNITVRVTDAFGKTHDTAFAIAVTD